MNGNHIIEKINNSITFSVTKDIEKNEIQGQNFSIDLLMGDQVEGIKYDEDYNVLNQDEIDKANEINSREKICLNSSLPITLNNNNKDGMVFDGSFKYVGSNSFIYSAIKAYSEHHHLIIRPDDVWMSILVQFSTYINKYSNDIKNKFVDLNEKKLLTVYTDYPILKAPHDKLTISLVNEIEKNIKDPSIVDWLIPNFTTTTATDRVVYSAALMSTVKSFFDYKCTTYCGLPSVTLNGSVEDWVQIKERIERLKEYDIMVTKDEYDNIKDDNYSFINKQNLMSEWVSFLHPVLDEFIATASGKPDIEWWKLIVKEDNRSGGPIISGWITVFCLYNNRSECLFETNCFREKIKEQRKKNINTWLKISWNKILNGYVSVPLILQELDGTIYNTTLFAGHLTINVKDIKTIQPSLDWLLIVDK